MDTLSALGAPLSETDASRSGMVKLIDRVGLIALIGLALIVLARPPRRSGEV